MKDLSVANDFFYYSLVKNDINKVPITLDNVLTILPHITQLIGSKYDVYIKNGIKSAWNILKCFSDRVISAKSVALSNGVDLAREERLKKCDNFIEIYEKIPTIPSLDRIIQKQSGDEVISNINIAL